MTKLPRGRPLSRHLSVSQLVKISKRLEAEDEALRVALGFPRGIPIPEEPLPTTEEARQAELAAVVEKLEEVMRARFAAPPGQEYQSLGRHMIHLQNRRWKLLNLK